jgi:hypothetical protein
MGENAKKVLLLFAAMAVAVVPWGSSLPSWQDALITTNFFPLVGILGGVLMSWLGQSPLKK